MRGCQMNNYYQNRRLDRRIPLGSNAVIRLDGGSEIEANCVELGVGGMTLHSTYVPGEGEEFEVAVDSPEGRLTRPPLVVRVLVRRCNAIEEGLYEIGVSTLKVVG